MPFWGFAWVGGQALARHILDHPEQVQDRTVLDLGSGSGVVAIAAARAGARLVTASDVDALARAAVQLNAEANSVRLNVVGNVLESDSSQADVILAGDIFYEANLGGAALPFLERAHARGALVLVGDPGRSYLPRLRLEPLARYPVTATDGLEDAEVKTGTVWGLRRPRSHR